jgi:hypothetical protein
MKLSPLTIIIIGFSIAIIALSYGFFQHYVPNSTETQYQEAYRDQLQAQVDLMPRARQRVEEAKAMVQLKADQWRQTVAVHTPAPDVGRGGISLAVNPWQLTVDSRKFRNNMQRALNAQLRRGGVRVVGTGPRIPDPEESASGILANYYNFPAIPFPVVIFDLGAVTVSGTYEQIMTHVRSYSNMPRYLAVTDGLQLTGTAPRLTGTYNLTLVGYIRGTRIYPAVPEGAATASNSQGGRGPGAG